MPFVTLSPPEIEMARVLVQWITDQYDGDLAQLVGTLNRYRQDGFEAFTIEDLEMLQAKVNL